jgi:hypothetical protein
LSQSDELIEIKGRFMGIQRGDYPGAFPPKVETTIRSIAESPCLHLFSGSSTIGDVRVDLLHENATLHKDVFEFVTQDNRDWKFVVLDPDYNLESKHNNSKLKSHAKTESVTGNVLYQRLIERFLKAHAENVLWFDMASPKPFGFYRHKTWLYLTNSYFHVRVLTWLKREGEFLTASEEKSESKMSEPEIIWNFGNPVSRINYCVDCGKPIEPEERQCQDCFQRLKL